MVLDSCSLANQELIQSSLNEVIHEYFNWTTSIDVPDQDDYDDDSCSSDSDSVCLESDAFSEDQDDCPDLRETDGNELGTIRNFLKAGCGCQFGPKAHHCSSTLSYSEVLESHTNCLQPSKEELDLIILSHLQCHLRWKEVGGRKRKRYVCNFFFSRQQICKTTYLFLLAVGRERYANLCEHYKLYRVTLHVHGNKGRLPKNMCTFESISEVSKFISNYAEEQYSYYAAYEWFVFYLSTQQLSNCLICKSSWELEVSLCASSRGTFV